MMTGSRHTDTGAGTRPARPGTRAARRRAPRPVRVVALAVLLAGGLVSCAAETPSPSPSASGSPQPSASPSPSEVPASQRVVFYFAVNQPTGVTLIGEPRQFEGSTPLLYAALAALIDGTVQPADPDYENLWGSGTALLSATVGGDTLTVDLAMGALNVGAEGEARAIDQILWTANAIEPVIENLAITVDGAVVETLAGHVDTTGVIRRQPAESVLNPVQVDAPAEGEEVTGEVVVSGVACVFEANVNWELTSGAGAEVASGFTLTAGACPSRSAWEVDLGELEPGDYLFSAIEYSAEDGSVTSVDDKSFTVAD